MSAPRVFVSGILAPGDRATLAGDDARKLRVVLRMSEGDGLAVTDSSGRRYAATLAFDGPRAYAAIGSELEGPAPLRLRITLAQGLPKGAKMDYVVEKATELGVVAILPFESERTVGERRGEGKLERWRRIARSAAEQCGRTDVPDVATPADFRGVLEAVRAAPLALIPWELAERIPLRDRLPALLGDVREVLLVIGPEGGFSETEALAAQDAGAHAVSLGSRILRTETAGLVACAALLYASGDV